MRRPLVVGNWKMHGLKDSNEQLLSGLLTLWQGVHHVEVAVCPSHAHLDQAAGLLAESNIGLGAQDISPFEGGANTGDTSGAMLDDLGCRYVIVGHSERRTDHGETDSLVAQKAQAAIKADLVPIICVGETLAQREAEEALDVIGAQLKAVIDLLGRRHVTGTVIAYEPVWAIGTGKTATPEQAQEVHSFIREQLGEVGQGVRILYGGSVKPNNAPELFAKQDIDGALVGGASLNAEDFVAICRAAE